MPVPAALTRYGRLLLPAGARQALVLGTLARLPIGTTALALLLLVQRETGSIARASLVSATFSAALAVAAPVRGRAVDRRGGRWVLRRYGAAHPVLLLCLLASVLTGLALPWVLLLAATAGATFPPVGPLVRSLWGVLYEGADRTTAYALDAVLVEVAFVTGPLLVGLAVALGDPGYAVVASAVLVGTGALLLSRTAVARLLTPDERTTRPPLWAPLAAPRVRRLLVAVVVLGVAFGGVEVAVAAFALEQGATPLAGPLLAVWAVGSAVGGLAYGAREWALPVEQHYPRVVAVLAAGLALPLLAVGPWSLGALLLATGAAMAPFSACNSALLARAAPQGSSTATFAWSGSAVVAGIAAGTAATGPLVESGGARAGFLLAAAAGALALVTVRAGRTRTRP